MDEFKVIKNKEDIPTFEVKGEGFRVWFSIDRFGVLDLHVDHADQIGQFDVTIDHEKLKEVSRVLGP